MPNKSFLLFLLFTIFSIVLKSQNTVEMADALRSNGKIFVVVAIILIILSGLFVVLFRIDKKLSRLEKELKERKNTP